MYVNRNKRYILFFIFIALFVLMGIWYRNSLYPYFTIESLKAQKEYLQIVVKDHYVKSVLSFILAYVFVIVCFMPISALLTVAGGFLFGILPGTLYTNIGATIGATLSFLMVRNLIGVYMQNRYKKELEQFNVALEKNEVSYLLMMHFVAVIPFPVVNILAGLTRVSTWRFFWTTSVGIFPVSLIYAPAGKQLMEIESTKDIFSLKVIFILFLLTLAALLPIYINWYKKSRIIIKKA